jgi:hypothetical protein
VVFTSEEADTATIAAALERAIAEHLRSQGIAAVIESMAKTCPRRLPGSNPMRSHLGWLQAWPVSRLVVLRAATITGSAG